MKKSILLSSIMAIVLVLALSTATFAWYGSSTQASATMATLEASSGSGNLQISLSRDSGWTNHVDISPDEGNLYVPASLKKGVTTSVTEWNKAESWFIGKKNGDNTYTIDTATGTYMYSYNIYLKNAGATTVTVTLANASLKFENAYTGDETVIDDASDQLADQAAFMIFKDDVAYANSEYYTTASTSSTAGEKVEAVAAPTFDMTAGQVVHFVVYNWVDGWQASSEGSSNSQRGQVKFNLNFSIPSSEPTPAA